MSHNPPRKRPRVAQGFSAGGRGSLIASLIGSPQEQLASAASAKNAEKDAAAKRSRDYARIAKDYSDGQAPYGATIASIKSAMAAETDPELKSILQGYVNDIETTKVTRDVNAKVDAYNQGGISFGELQQALTTVPTDNELLKSGIAKALAGARKAENGRQLDKLNTQYSDGKLDINAYLNAVHTLRSDPSQKDPSELAKFDAAISGAKQNERQLNDQKAYAQWEAGGNPDAAIAYFSARIATATDPKDVANLGKFIDNIKTIVKQETAKGNASVGASLKATVASANKQLADAKETVDKIVEAARGDPQIIVDAYKQFGELAASFVPYVGSEAGYFLEKSQSATPQGRAVAATEVTKKVDAEVKRLQDAIDAAKKDKSLSPRAIISRLSSMADNASELERLGKYGKWTTPEQQQHGTDMRLEAFRQANEVADQQFKELGAARQKSESLTAAAFTDASRALKADPKSNLAAALRSGGAFVLPNGQQIRSDGKVFDAASGKWVDADFSKAHLDANRFSEWLAESPQTNGLMVFDASHTRGTGQTGVDTAASDQTFDNSRVKYVDALTNTLTEVGQLQKDTTVALNESHFIKSPKDRYSTGGLGNDNLDATRLGGDRPNAFKPSLALPLTDSRDGNSFSQGENTGPAPAPTNNRFDAGNVDRGNPGAPPFRQPASTTLSVADTVGGVGKALSNIPGPSSTMAGVGAGIGDFIQSIFGTLSAGNYTPPPTVGGASAGANALVADSSSPSSGISGVEQAVPTFRGFSTADYASAMDRATRFTEPGGAPGPTPETPTKWAWDVPASNGGGSTSGEAINGPQLTQ